MEGGSYRPHVLLWIDADSGLILGMKVVPPSSRPEETADALVGAIGTVPGYAGPSRPRLVRIADEDLAAALRVRLGPGVTVRVAPTPELDEVMRSLAQSTGPGDGEPAYIETEDTTPATVAALFEAARRFGRAAPWRIAGDAQVIRLDAPAFGIDGGVISVIGALRGAMSSGRRRVTRCGAPVFVSSASTSSPRRNCRRRCGRKRYAPRRAAVDSRAVAVDHGHRRGWGASSA
jgi:hypothetical protein